MSFWGVFWIIIGFCVLIRLMGALFGEAPTVASVIAAILIIIEFILVIKFRNLTKDLVASVKTDKELLRKAEWIYILFIVIVLMSFAPVLFDPDMDFLGIFETEIGEFFVFLIGSPPFVGVLLTAAGLGAVFVFAFSKMTFLIILLIVGALWNGYMIFSSISDAI